MVSTTFWIQFIGIIFGASMLYFTFVKFKRKEISYSELIVWFFGWVLLMIVAIIPGILDFIIAPLNFYRRLDFFVVFGFFVLLGLSFYNYTSMKKMERKLELFVRRSALNQHRRK
tara:strand:- start:11669 stop:12013 length:345 start_codon:yes stop_codon:yes gene_type:complete